MYNYKDFIKECQQEFEVKAGDSWWISLDKDPLVLAKAKIYDISPKVVVLSLIDHSGSYPAMAMFKNKITFVEKAC